MNKKPDLRTVVLIDNKYNIDLLCNPYLVEDIKKVKGPLRIQSNGREMSANKKAEIPGYTRRVCFSRRAVINIIVLKKINEQ